MIPKRIFFYWSGDKLSWMRYMTLYSFRKFNPDWEMILYHSNNNYIKKEWTGIEEQDFSNFNGEDYFDKLDELNIKIIDFDTIDIPSKLREKFKDISPVHKSDMFRYYDLYKNGGFYSDMDILYFRSFDEEYNNIVENRYDTILYQDPTYVAIGFLGCKKNNNFFKKLYFSLFTIDGKDNYQSFGVDAIYKMFGTNRQKAYIIDKLNIKFNNQTCYSIPKSLVYHFDWNRIIDNYRIGFNIDDFDKQSIGYHWYGGHNESQKANNEMNEDNYHRYHTVTFSKIVDYVLRK